MVTCSRQPKLDDSAITACSHARATRLARSSRSDLPPDLASPDQGCACFRIYDTGLQKTKRQLNGSQAYAQHDPNDQQEHDKRKQTV